MYRFWGCMLLVLLPIIILAQDAPSAPSATEPSEPVQLPVAIKPDDSRLYLIGRFDRTDNLGPKCQWPHTQVRIRFRGTGLQARIWTDERTYLQVEIDGKPTSVLHPGKGEHLLDLAAKLPASEHEAAISKRTEWHTGVVQFRGFFLDADGELLPAQRMTRFIEIIGDTVVSGYGNEARLPNEDYLPEHQNAYMSFGAIAGRELNAEVSCIGCGAYGELISRYEQVLMFQPGIKWQFAPQPDAVVVMGSMFGFVDPERAEGFIKEFKALVQKVRSRNPQATIYLATNPVVSDEYPAGKECFTKMREALQKIEAELTVDGDAGIRYLEFATQDSQRDGMGGGYNPTIRTHQGMARKLAGVLSQDLNWQDEPAIKPEQ